MQEQPQNWVTVNFLQARNLLAPSCVNANRGGKSLNPNLICLIALRLMSGPSMNSPLTYPDQSRDDNLIEFFFGMIGTFVRKALLELLVCLFEALA
jgi:hypothetical protein